MLLNFFQYIYSWSPSEWQSHITKSSFFILITTFKSLWSPNNRAKSIDQATNKSIYPKHPNINLPKPKKCTLGSINTKKKLRDGGSVKIDSLLRFNLIISFRLSWKKWLIATKYAQLWWINYGSQEGNNGKLTLPWSRSWRISRRMSEYLPNKDKRSPKIINKLELFIRSARTIERLSSHWTKSWKNW